MKQYTTSFSPPFRQAYTQHAHAPKQRPPVVFYTQRGGGGGVGGGGGLTNGGAPPHPGHRPVLYLDMFGSRRGPGGWSFCYSS